MEDLTTITYGFLGLFPCIAVSSFEKLDEIPVSHG